jgi:hypothetical protein
VVQQAVRPAGQRVVPVVPVAALPVAVRQEVVPRLALALRPA